MSAASTSAILRHIPSELLEEILLKLPVKSLLRFSSVSKSWLSMISESRFVQEHMRRTAVNGVERMVTTSLHDLLDRNTFVRRIPYRSSPWTDDSTRLICPIEGILHRLRAFCDGLWLVEAQHVAENYWGPTFIRDTKKSLYLWNPSTRTHRKLPDSPLPTIRLRKWTEFVYGLGYDSAADDYKILKIAPEESSPIPTELYSLKSDSWKTISPPPPGIKRQERCAYVNGSFHWIRTFSNTNTIVSFNLSTEKCGEIAFPAIALDSDYNWKYADVEVVVVRGKLCVIANNVKINPDGFCFVWWVMEEYGVEKSWSIMFIIEFHFSDNPYGNLRPLYFYDTGDILFNSSHDGLYMYKNEGAQMLKIESGDESTIRGGFIYVESLVSPLPGYNQ